MSKASNPFDSFVKNKEKLTAAADQSLIDEVKSVKRGAGRPKKAEKQQVQITTIRLDPDDHLEVRQLALRKKMAMNELVFVALQAYCKTQGVLLKGIT
jgi:predicted HicB family RNase H-like nuclease